MGKEDPEEIGRGGEEENNDRTDRRPDEEDLEKINR